jgi:hypothetical protein
VSLQSTILFSPALALALSSLRLSRELSDTGSEMTEVPTR